ncbi:MAG: hypothetical protein H6977_09375 [Gammaproteobacteria bacterium]|nr:hypothetical protein [Planctomycetota bacterium]MCB1747542.1 hypothetical protein [Gammaproteobacteria bacterium]MCP5200214.1 hypothetical protein [Gammaproteobacteria bacterium]
MMMTCEISMYPVRDEYLPPIKDFIARLNAAGDVEVTTSATSTCLVGEYGRIMDLLREAMAASQAEFGTAVFVTKFIPGYVPD